MSQAETQERTTVGLQKDASQDSLVQYVLKYGVDFAWLIGWLGLGIAFVTALNSPSVIVVQAGGSVLIEGVDFRVVVGSIFLMGFRTILPGLIWVWNRFEQVRRTK